MSELRRHHGFSALGMLFVYAVWFVCAWFVFTYGMGIYTLGGVREEREFLRGWGVGVGLENIKQWEDIAKAVRRLAAVPWRRAAGQGGGCMLPCAGLAAASLTARAVLSQTAEMLFVYFLLDSFGMHPAHAWLEENVDYMSVQARELACPRTPPEPGDAPPAASLTASCVPSRPCAGGDAERGEGLLVWAHGQIHAIPRKGPRLIEPTSSRPAAALGTAAASLQGWEAACGRRAGASSGRLFGSVVRLFGPLERLLRVRQAARRI